MNITDITAPLPYQLTQLLPSLGLAAVVRDGEGLFLDFLGREPTTAVRIALFAADGQKMLADLRRVVDLLSQEVPGNTPTSHH
jgi:hypothetical protein